MITLNGVLFAFLMILALTIGVGIGMAYAVNRELRELRKILWLGADCD